jgi:hypothetical protein
VLGWIFPFPLLVGTVGGCGSLADRWTNAGARLLCLVPVGAVPGIISILELSLDELSVCWSRLRISRMSPAIECSSEDTCRDNWSILALISSIGRPGPLWKSPGTANDLIQRRFDRTVSSKRILNMRQLTRQRDSIGAGSSHEWITHDDNNTRWTEFWVIGDKVTKESRARIIGN